jgi:hypothetical protein
MESQVMTMGENGRRRTPKNDTATGADEAGERSTNPTLDRQDAFFG